MIAIALAASLALSGAVDLKKPVRAPAARREQAAAARALIDAALAGDSAAERETRRRALTFSESGSVFTLDDAGALVAQAKRDKRAAWLSAARQALAAAAAIDAEERALVENAARTAGLSRRELLARRAGLDEATLRRLVESALSSTAPLLSSVASDVTLLPDVVRGAGTVPDVTGAAASSARRDFTLALRDVALAKQKDGVRALVIELRASALAVLAELDGKDGDARDALASRILDDGAGVVAGAAVFLDVDARGTAVDRFVAALRSATLARALAGGAALPEAQRAFDDAPPLEEQGFPDAFVAVVKILPELLRR